MGINLGATCMKYALFVFNIFFFFCGVVLLALGIWGRVSDDNYLEEIVTSNKDALDATYVICIVVGLVLFLIGFLGCCGACTENRLMLILFAVLLIIITVVEFVIIILAAIYKNDIDKSLRDEMMKQVNEQYVGDTSKGLDKAWNELQYEFECCGSNGFKDYLQTSEYYKNQAPTAEVNRTVIPETCCKLSNKKPQEAQPRSYDICNTEARNDETNPSQLYRRGCYDELQNWVEDHAYIFIAACIIIVIIQIIGVVFACYVCHAIKDK